MVVIASLLLFGLAGVPAEASAESCPNEQLRAEQGDQHLPDCRAYEQVTPSDKAGTQDLTFGEGQVVNVTVASNGERVSMWAAGPMWGEDPSPTGVNAVFSRGASGWLMASLQPPQGGEDRYEPQVWNPELTLFGTDAYSLPSYTVNSPEQTFRVGPAGGPYAQVLSEPYLGASESRSPALAGTSQAFAHVVLRSTDHTLAPGGTATLPEAYDLYDWSKATGQLQLANVTNGGSLVNTCGAEIATQGETGPGSQTGFLRNPVSSDGSLIFFTAPELIEKMPQGNRENAACKEPRELYARIDGRETIDISAPEPGVSDPTGLHSAGFIGATADGSKVWFVTETELTADDHGHAPELYEYDTANQKLVRVSRGESGVAVGEVDSNEIAISEDGSTLYFSAGGQLTANAPSAGVSLRNIYRYETATGKVTYVGSAKADENGGVPIFTERTGAVLGFESKEHVLGPDGASLYSGTSDQLFRYEVAHDEAQCITCQTSSGKTTLYPSKFPGYLESSWETLNPVSEGGRYMFFESGEELVPQDTNGAEASGGARRSWDAYEWEAPGAGSCANAEGCLNLISSGTSSQAARFEGASRSGDDLFFFTHSALVPQDVDVMGDIYDARVNGGIAGLHPTAVCAGESCRLIGSTPPVFGTPESLAFSGASNPSAAPVVRAVKSKKAKKKKSRKHKRKQGKAVKGRKARRDSLTELRVNGRGR